MFPNMKPYKAYLFEMNYGGTKKFLEEAINLIETTGWSQGAYQRNEKGEACPPGVQASSYCILGAIRAVSRDEDITALMRVELTHRLGCSVVEFNDHPERTKEEVLEKLKQIKDSL